MFYYIFIVFIVITCGSWLIRIVVSYLSCRLFPEVGPEETYIVRHRMSLG